MITPTRGWAIGAGILQRDDMTGPIQAAGKFGMVTQAAEGVKGRRPANGGDRCWKRSHEAGTA